MMHFMIQAALILLVISMVFLWITTRSGLSARKARDGIKDASASTYTGENNRKKIRRMIGRLEHWQIVSAFLIVYDVVAVNLSFFFALWFRFDCVYSQIPPEYLRAYLCFAPWYTIVCLLVFRALHLYNSIWRFAGYSELLRIAAATAITFIFHTVGITAAIRRMPVSYYLFGILIQTMLVTGVRFSYRFVLLERSRMEKSSREEYIHHVMLVGAGAAGQMILKDIIHAKETKARVCCIIDDNSNKWGRYMEGVPIVGGREDILLNVEKYRIDQIFLAIPSASAQTRRDILDICKETGCAMKTLPGMYQFVTGEVSVSKMKDVAVEDLLGREPIRVNMDEIFAYLSGKTILVTGGGGSIGSELCRQIAGHNPKRLVIFDVYENNAYDIEQELRANYPNLDLVTLIGSVRDSRRIDDVFARYRPEVVYHAAAHKHVPLMETSPCEAIKNNVIGTYKTAYSALKYGCRRFVLVSTDKAVNPTNIMGASKRLCEMVIQSMDRVCREGNEGILPALGYHYDCEGRNSMGGRCTIHTGNMSMDHTRERAGSRTEFVAVRFGNVLGSNGSVIPLFKKQIEKGGPVTVTHPDIIRYFMTIPEAVSLVLQAGTYAKGGEIFVLDMGAPVRIDTLARNLIKLSGYKPDVDIQIEYVGLRPGEKLYEEKLMAEEGLTKTPNDLIHIGKPVDFDTERFLQDLGRLAGAAYENSWEICSIVAEIVPTYHPAESDLELHKERYEELLEQAEGA